MSAAADCRQTEEFERALQEIRSMDRDVLKKRVAPLEPYKCTPRTNCGQCGPKTCIAFATMVVTGQEKISACPCLDEEKVRPLRERLEDQGVDCAAEFAVFPKLAIRLLFWDEVKDEGYACRVKFLFDSRVLQVLDLESLLFACEQITDRLSGKV